ncbi:hypothetical protein NMG60_11005630 [Bertholletia excelsa]
MSSSSEVSDLGKVRPARAPERSSNFVQTCNLLSQYLKEKGTFGDLGLGVACGFDVNGKAGAFRQPATAVTSTTMNLFPVDRKSGEVLDVSSRNASPTSRNLTSMDLFPQHSGFASKEEVDMKADSSVNKPEPETAQMTIFYNGQVIVFNDFPADKAKEVMLMASKGSSHKPVSFACVPEQNPIEPINLIPSSSSVVSNFGNKVSQERVQQPPKPVVNDLPIARKASLTRFLEKRKDRITAKAPYQTSLSTAPPAKQVEGKSWLGLAAQSPVQL